MVRSKIKSAAALALNYSGVAGAVGRYNGNRGLPLVIGYHRVVDDFKASARGYTPSMLISTAMLEKQLDWIGRRYTFVDPDNLDIWLAGRRPINRPAAVISFDDGYRDVYEHAFPILKRKGIPAVTFVVTDLVGTDGLQLHDELYLLLSQALSRWRSPRKRVRSLLEAAQVESRAPAWSPTKNDLAAVWMKMLHVLLPRSALLRVIQALRNEFSVAPDVAGGLQCMDWNMLGKLRDAGIRVGSHSRSHALLTNENTKIVRAEVRDSRRVLEDQLGSKVCNFAYPDGRFNPAVVSAVAEAGYRFAYTTCRHRNSQFPSLTIPRRLLWEKSCLDLNGHFSPSVMNCQVNGVFDYHVGGRATHGG